MARTKKTSSKPIESDTQLLKQFKWGESYMSLLMGIIVIVVVSFLTISLIKQGFFNGHNNKKEISSDKTEAPLKSASSSAKQYTVNDGDTLKTISTNFYGTEDHWLDIAQANNIADPNVIDVGQQLQIPALNQTNSEKITSSTYVVRDGDLLWDIAVRAYGDGFRWPDIAKANNLDTPDQIYSGLQLKIPR